MRNGSADQWQTVSLTDHDNGQIVVLTLCRPDVLNAISRQLANELLQACQYLAGQAAVRVVVLTGAGERAFCAGADLKERRGLSASERAEHTAAIEEAAEALAALPMATIAALHGFALAGGAELAIACDLRVATRDTVLGFPEVKIGIFPGAGGVLRLPRLVGGGAARDLLYTGRQVDAESANAIGLVDRVVEPGEHLPAALALGTEIAANAPLAVRAIKQALDQREGVPHAAARQRVNALRLALDDTQDYEEGLRAFAEKRPPRFSGQ
jgi:enoyl-CoA hydratase/carnithine racemase